MGRGPCVGGVSHDHMVEHGDLVVADVFERLAKLEHLGRAFAERNAGVVNSQFHGVSSSLRNVVDRSGGLVTRSPSLVAEAALWQARRSDQGDMMDFDYSPKVMEAKERLEAFMDEHVYPNVSASTTTS